MKHMYVSISKEKKPKKTLGNSTFLKKWQGFYKSYMGIFCQQIFSTDIRMYNGSLEYLFLYNSITIFLWISESNSFWIPESRSLASGANAPANHSIRRPLLGSCTPLPHLQPHLQLAESFMQQTQKLEKLRRGQLKHKYEWKPQAAQIRFVC